MDWLDRVAFSRDLEGFIGASHFGGFNLLIFCHHLHCTIEKIYPAPGASRPRCRLLLTEFGVPNPLNQFFMYTHLELVRFNCLVGSYSD